MDEFFATAEEWRYRTSGPYQQHIEILRRTHVELRVDTQEEIDRE